MCIAFVLVQGRISAITRGATTGRVRVGELMCVILNVHYIAASIVDQFAVPITY